MTGDGQAAPPMSGACNEDPGMTTDIRAAPSRSRVGQRSSNFHEPSRSEAYAASFSPIALLRRRGCGAGEPDARAADGRDEGTRTPARRSCSGWDDDAA